MSRLFKRSLRIGARVLWLGGEVVLALMRFTALLAARAGIPNRKVRALWLQRVCQRALRVLNLEIVVAGPVPSRGLLVCNHLSYLDILVLAALTPCVFVAKREVKHWRVLGWFAKLAGTIFVHREKRAQAGQTVDEIETALRTGALVVLFPEGTSSSGDTVLPFKSSLLEPAARQTHPLAVGLLRYELGDGDVSEEVCYWKDMTLVPHLINLFSKPTIQASVHFDHFGKAVNDRKQLARQLHAEVLRMKNAVAN